jgi:hypothetical protein
VTEAKQAAVSEARERYKRHLAAEKALTPSESPYYVDYGNAWWWRETLMGEDRELLARHASEERDGEVEVEVELDAARYRMLRSQRVPHIVGDSHRHIYVASVEFYDEQDICGDELDAAIDAAIRKDVP